MRLALNSSQVNHALTGLTTCFLAVVATLKVRFAEALTLGASLAETLEKMLEANVLPKLEVDTSITKTL